MAIVNHAQRESTMDQGQTIAASRHDELVERDRSPIDRELAAVYEEISVLSELVAELDRRTKPLQAPDHGAYATPQDGSDDPVAPSPAWWPAPPPVVRTIREQHHMVEQINDQLRTILSALQT